MSDLEGDLISNLFTRSAIPHRGPVQKILDNRKCCELAEPLFLQDADFPDSLIVQIQDRLLGAIELVLNTLHLDSNRASAPFQSQLPTIALFRLVIQDFKVVLAVGVFEIITCSALSTRGFRTTESSKCTLTEHGRRKAFGL